jgi:hypothetical protein
MKFSNTFATLTASCLLCSASFAGGANYQAPANDWQFGVSGMVEESIDDFALGLQAQNDRLELGVTGSADWDKTNAGVKYSEFHLGGFVGARQELASKVYGSIGVTGIYTWISGDWAQTNIVQNNPYVVGPYLGLAYQPFAYFQAFLRIMPYSYEISEGNDKKHEVFEHGQFGVAYYFN